MPTVRMAPVFTWESIMSCLTPATAAAAMQKPMKPNTKATAVQMPVRLLLVLRLSISWLFMAGDSMSEKIGRDIVGCVFACLCVRCKVRVRVVCGHDFGRAARKSIGSGRLASHKISPGGMERGGGDGQRRGKGRRRRSRGKRQVVTSARDATWPEASFVARRSARGRIGGDGRGTHRVPKVPR